tara:strand:+ start:26153 stop:26542 length:390 start_codon:yes stop_codon:yes gene_type:complete
MFGIKQLKNEIADINRKLERILWILSDKPQSIDESFKKQFMSEVDQEYKRRTKSTVKYKTLKSTIKAIDRFVLVLSKKPQSMKQIANQLKITEHSARTYLRDARAVGYKINRIQKRINRKIVSYYEMEV